ncbi:hypothetical protein KCV06_g665, partial [Aureobasidium melanogenum]
LLSSFVFTNDCCYEVRHIKSRGHEPVSFWQEVSSRVSFIDRTKPSVEELQVLIQQRLCYRQNDDSELKYMANPIFFKKTVKSFKSSMGSALLLSRRLVPDFAPRNSSSSMIFSTNVASKQRQMTLALVEAHTLPEVRDGRHGIFLHVEGKYAAVSGHSWPEVANLMYHPALMFLTGFWSDYLGQRREKVRNDWHIDRGGRRRVSSVALEDIGKVIEGGCLKRSGKVGGGEALEGQDGEQVVGAAVVSSEWSETKEMRRWTSLSLEGEKNSRSAFKRCMGSRCVESWVSHCLRHPGVQLLSLLLSLLAVLVGVLHGALWTAEGVVGSEGVRILAREIDLAWSARCSGE